MKRFEKQAAQHQLLREAAFSIVRREGTCGLSRRALAAELGAADAFGRRMLGDHVRLPALAAAECEERRRRARWRSSRLEQLVPPPSEVDVEVVWLRLLLAHGTRPAVAGGSSLAERYQLAVNDRVVSQPGPPDRGSADREADRAALASYVQDHAAGRRTLVTDLVGEQVEAVEALVDGLLLAVATGRLSASDAHAVLAAHLGRLGCSTA